MTLIKCDYDGRLPAKLIPWITQCCRLWRWPIEAIRYDRTRRGWHVVIGVRRRLDLPMIVAAQAILGSDRNREMLNLMRANAIARGGVPAFWQKRANVLFVSHSRGVKFRNT